MVEYCLCLWGRYIILPKLLRTELEASALQMAEKMGFNRFQAPSLVRPLTIKGNRLHQTGEHR